MMMLSPQPLCAGSNACRVKCVIATTSDEFDQIRDDVAIYLGRVAAAKLALFNLHSFVVEKRVLGLFES